MSAMTPMAAMAPMIPMAHMALMIPMAPMIPVAAEYSICSLVVSTQDSPAVEPRSNQAQAKF